jgi:hypothetical protein
MQPNEAHSGEYNNGYKTRCELSGYRHFFCRSFAVHHFHLAQGDGR